MKNIKWIPSTKIKCSCGCGNTIFVSYDVKDKILLLDIDDPNVKWNENHFGCSLVGVALYGKELERFALQFLQ